MQGNYAVFVQVVIFVTLWLVLKRLWFDPALRVLRERTARSEGALAEARTIQAEAERLRTEHAAALEEARGEAQREMQEMLRQADEDQKRLIGEAREDAQRTLAEVRGRIAQEVTAARQGLRDSVHDIARLVAEKILGRSL